MVLMRSRRSELSRWISSGRDMYAARYFPSVSPNSQLRPSRCSHKRSPKSRSHHSGRAFRPPMQNRNKTSTTEYRRRYRGADVTSKAVKFFAITRPSPSGGLPSDSEIPEQVKALIQGAHHSECGMETLVLCLNRNDAAH